MKREEAFKILKQNLSNPLLIKHCLAVETAMRGLAKHFGEDQEKWGMVGLLHDIDYERVKDDINQHSLLGAKMLEGLGFGEDICQAVKVHNEAHGQEPETLMEKALFVTDPLTGLIIASALVLPSRKLADLKKESVLRRFKEKAFARSANREIIGRCQEYLNLSLNDFVELILGAMQGIAPQLGL